MVTNLPARTPLEHVEAQVVAEPQATVEPLSVGQ